MRRPTTEGRRQGAPGTVRDHGTVTGGGRGESQRPQRLLFTE